MKEIFLEKDLSSSQVGQMGTGARSDHDATFDFESGSANVLELNDPRVLRVAPRIEQIGSVRRSIDGDFWDCFGHFRRFAGKNDLTVDLLLVRIDQFNLDTLLRKFDDGFERSSCLLSHEKRRLRDATYGICVDTRRRADGICWL